MIMIMTHYVGDMLGNRTDRSELCDATSDLIACLPTCYKWILSNNLFWTNQIKCWTNLSNECETVEY